MGNTERKRGRPAGDPHRAALNLRLDPGTIRRLKLHALIKDTTCSEIVIALVRDHLPDVRIDAPEGEADPLAAKVAELFEARARREPRHEEP